MPKAAILLLANLLLSGCASQLVDGPEQQRQSALPSSGAVNLRDHVLRISMPRGEPSALVLLNITKDLWVRPFMGGNAFVDDVRVPLRDDQYWILCTWVQSVGLADGFAYTGFEFWLRDGELEFASGHPHISAGFTDASGGHCLSYEQSPGRALSIAADEPFEGTLAVVLTARTPPLEFPVEELPVLPAFTFLIGIATKPCSDTPTDAQATHFCPPPNEQDAEPLLRGGLGIFAQARKGCPAACGEDPDTDCPACGFDLVDHRPYSGPLAGPGQVMLNRTTLDVEGVLFAMAVSDFSTMRVQVHADGDAEAWCRTPLLNSWAAVLASHVVPATVNITLQLNGPVIYGATSLEVPLGLSSVGLRVVPVGLGLYAPTFTGATVMECPGGG